MAENISEVDLAYQILSEAGKDNPIYFKKLIREVIARQNKVVQNEAAAISEIYTMVNMDSRFQHAGDGKWGLTDWYPPETKRTRGSSTRTEKTPSSKNNRDTIQDEESKSDQEQENTRQFGEIIQNLNAGTTGRSIGMASQRPVGSS